jgi:hypothetical protein
LRFFGRFLSGVFVGDKLFGEGRGRGGVENHYDPRMKNMKYIKK